MVILAVDTACGTCSAALARMDGSLLATAEEIEASRQAERLVPMVQELLAQEKITYQDLKLLVTTIGPGSFTGLRIGMTATKGIALVTRLPAIGISTLETVGWNAFAEHAATAPLLVLINAMRGQVYTQKFLTGMVAITEPVMIDIAELPGWMTGCATIAGNCTAIVKEALPGFAGRLLPDTLPHARDAAALAAARFAAGYKPQPPEPLYIRKPDAKLPGGKLPDDA